MEKHIFKFGETSLAMIIPKKWADKNGLSASSGISVTEGTSGELIVQTQQPRQQEMEKTMNKSMNPELVGRWVGLHYMFGTAKLRLRSKDGITGAQMNAIEAKLNNDCSGFEITTESSNELIIESLTDMKEVDIGKIMQRIRFIIDAEFKEMANGNYSMISGMEKRVNRFYMLGTRYLNIVQPKGYAKYYRALDLLEALSDSMSALTDYDRAKSSNELLMIMQKQFSICFRGFEGEEKSIEETESLRKEVLAKLSKGKMDRFQRYLMTKVVDCTSGIAEFGLNADRKEQF